MCRTDVCRRRDPQSDPFAGLLPAFAVIGLPHDPRAAACALGVQPAAFEQCSAGALQADFDLPNGSSWKLWPHLGVATWLGRDRSSQRPPVSWRWQTPSLDLTDSMRRLANLGQWLQEAQLLGDVEWSAPLPGYGVLDALTEGGIHALAGVWTGSHGQAIRAVLYNDGRLWAEDHARAELWLLTVLGAGD